MSAPVVGLLREGLGRLGFLQESTSRLGGLSLLDRRGALGGQCDLGGLGGNCSLGGQIGFLLQMCGFRQGFGRGLFFSELLLMLGCGCGCGELGLLFALNLLPSSLFPDRSFLLRGLVAKLLLVSSLSSERISCRSEERRRSGLNAGDHSLNGLGLRGLLPGGFVGATSLLGLSRLLLCEPDLFHVGQAFLLGALLLSPDEGSLSARHCPEGSLVELVQPLLLILIGDSQTGGVLLGDGIGGCDLVVVVRLRRLNGERASAEHGDPLGE